MPSDLKPSVDQSTDKVRALRTESLPPVPTLNIAALGTQPSTLGPVGSFQIQTITHARGSPFKINCLISPYLFCELRRGGDGKKGRLKSRLDDQNALPFVRGHWQFLEFTAEESVMVEGMRSSIQSSLKQELGLE